MALPGPFHLLTLVALSAALLGPGSTGALPSAPAPQEPGTGRLMGALRHLQLLDVTGTTPRRMRFATSTVKGVAMYERAIDDRSPLGEPAAFLETDHSVLPSPTWAQPVPWRIVELGEESWLVSVGTQGRTLQVQRFPEGDLVSKVENVTSFEAARAAGGVFQVLVRRGGELHLVTVAAKEEEVLSRRLLEPRVGMLAACFLDTPPGRSALPVIVALGHEEGVLVLHRVHMESGESLRFSTGVEVKSDDGIRVAALRDGSIDRIAIGLPDHEREWGRVESVAIAVDGSSASSSPFWPFDKPTDGAKNAVLTTRYGHAIGFTADADGDGRPDLVAGAPWGSFTEHVDQLSAAKHERIECLASPTPGTCIGASVSVSPCGRYVLVAGGKATYPEVLHSPAEASLFQVMGANTLVSTFLTHEKD